MARDMVKVRNYGRESYTEDFKGTKITVPGNGSIELDRDTAHEFLGTMSRPLPNGGFIEKNLDIEEIPGLAVEPVWECDLCGMKMGSDALLNEHLTSTHKEQLADVKPSRKK
jgi:hypothetical protein